MVILAITLYCPAMETMVEKGPAPKVVDQPKSNKKVMVMEATAYAYTGQKTATGTWPKFGTIAVDPEVIPFGSRLWVEGYGYGIAEDTGSAIKGMIIDVYMDKEDRALEWGRKKVQVITFSSEVL